MQLSLSLILPAYNAERTISDQIIRLLESAGEISPRFEILVIDDGSTDHTCDIADELAREYPQIRVIRHGQPRGMDGITETSLAKSKGEVLMMLTPGAPVQIAELKRLWQASQKNEAEALGMPPAMKPLSKALLGRLSQWGTAVTSKTESQPKTVRLLHRAGTSSQPKEPNRPANFLAHLRNLAVGD